MNSTPLNFFDNKFKMCATLFVLTFVLYFKSIFYDFSPFDDQWLVVKNSEFLKDWSNIKLVFSQGMAGLYYRPMLSLSFMLDYHLGGLSPKIYHLTSIVIHGFSVLLLFKLLKLFDIQNKAAFLFSLLFAVHPIMLHATTWIPGRNDLLLTLFALCSLVYLVRYLKEKKTSLLLFHALFFVCSLLSKENAFLIIVVYIQVYILFNSFNKKLIPLFLLWILLVLSWFILRNNIISHYPSLGHNLFNSLKNFVFGFLMFIGKTLIPWNQSVFPTIKTSLVLTGAIVLIAFVYMQIKFGLQNKKIAYLGLTLFFILLAVPVWYGATSSTGEHYEQRIHTAMIGLIIYITQIKFNYKFKYFYTALQAIIIVFAAKTFYRMDVYQTPMTFLDSGINEDSRYYHFYFQKANLLYEQRQIQASVENFNKAIELQPRRSQLYFNRGNAYAELGKKNNAIADYDSAYKYSNQDPFILVTRCMTYNRFNDIENAMADLEELQKCCAKDIPGQLETEIVFKWANTLYERMNKQIEAEPNNAMLYVKRAKYFMDKRMGNEALADLKKACELEPNNEEFKTYYNALNKSFPHK